MRRRLGCRGNAPTCHFRQAGLKDGVPLNAPSSVVNTYRTCSCLSRGARWGSWFAEYARSGNRSKRCLIGAGTSKILRDGAWRRLYRAGALASAASDMLAGGCMALVHVVIKSSPSALRRRAVSPKLAQFEKSNIILSALQHSPDATSQL